MEPVNRMRHTTDSTAGLAAVAEDAARRAGAYLMEQMGQARIWLATRAYARCIAMATHQVARQVAHQARGEVEPTSDTRGV